MSVAAPRLVSAPGEYEQKHFENFSRVLTLYFNALQNNIDLLVPYTGALKNVNFGLFKLTAATVETSGYTVATLPTGVIGARTYVTNANATTFASVVAGGGANIVPVFYNGTNWIIA